MNLEADRQEILAIVQANRAEHEAIYREAVEAWKARVIDEVTRILDRVARGDVLAVVSRLPVPEIHLDDYDRAIRTLELHRPDTIELTETDVAQFIQDDWGWKRAFTTNTTSYTSR